MRAESKRRARWVVAGLLLGAVVGLLWSVREPSSPLTAERLAAARERWAAEGPEDYALEIEVAGAVAGRHQVEVRGDEVVAMRSDGRSVDPAAWEYWSVDGLFDFLATELDNAARPERTYGVQDPAAIVLRTRFHPRLGYPERFLRHVMGEQGSSVEWTVVALEAGE